MGYRRRWSDLSDTLRADHFLSQLPRDFADAKLTFNGVAEVEQALVVDYQVERVQLPVTNDGRILIQPPEALMRFQPIPLQEDRQLPVWLPYRQSRELEANFELPPDAIIENVPEEVQLEAPGLQFRSRWTLNRDGKQVTWSGQFICTQLRFSSESYEQTRDFILNVRRALRHGVVVETSGGSVATTYPQ